MSAKRLLSISEVNEPERGYALGAATLGIAFRALYQRWDANLRDEETLLRLIFLQWYSRTEPGYLTGLDGIEQPPSIDELLDAFGGEQKLSADSLFTIAMLGYGEYAFGLGDENEWRSKSIQYFKRASELEPKSDLMVDWQFFTGERKESSRLKTKMRVEAHARFFGRGYMGTYIRGRLNSSMGKKD